jgi:G:T-mismatch repair DNA endonuclease (very short patch repair protein)
MNIMKKKVKCRICGGEFDHKMFKLHVVNSHRTNFSTQQEVELFVLTQRYDVTKLTIDKMVKEYENDGSVYRLVKKYQIPHRSLSLMFTLSGVKLKTMSEVANQKSVRSMYTETCLDKYGVNNVSQDMSIKNKKRDTFTKNYGVDNIFRLEEFKATIDDLMIKKYGVKRISGWHSFSDEQKRETVSRLHNGSVSKLEGRIGSILIQMGFQIESQFMIKKLSYDFLVANTNLIVEVNGDFWHANPKKYKATDILKFPKEHVIAESLWKKDERKLNLAKASGYQVITLWEADIDKLSDVELELFIAEKINNLV